MQMVATHQNRFFLLSRASECMLYKQAASVMLQETELTVMLTGRAGGVRGRDMTGSSRRRGLQSLGTESHRKRRNASDQTHHCLSALGFLTK